MRAWRSAAWIIMAVLAAQLTGCAIRCARQQAKVVDRAAAETRRVPVQVAADNPCRVGDLTIHRQGGGWVLGGTIRSCRHLHRGPIALSVQALDGEGRVVATHRGRARHRRGTRRFHGCPRARFRLAIPAPASFHRLVLTAE